MNFRQLTFSAAVLGAFAPGLAMAQCVTQDNLVCGVGSSASPVGSVLASRAGNFTPASQLVAGDQVIVRDGQGSVQIGSCTVRLNANALTSLVARGNSLCVSSSAPAGSPPPNTGANMGMVAAGAVGIAAIAGIAILAADNDDRAPASP